MKWLGELPSSDPRKPFLLESALRNAAFETANPALFESWTAAEPVQVNCVQVEQVAPYEPGAFYKRELPGLLKALASVELPLEAIIIDAYVWLDEGRGGLGWHLYEALERKIPVVGVAKTRFRPAEKVAIPVLRGESQNPLWVTAIGIEVAFAAERVKEMAGEFRVHASHTRRQAAA